MVQHMRVRDDASWWHHESARTKNSSRGDTLMSRHNIFRALSKRSTARWAMASSMLLLLDRFPAPAHVVLPCTTPLFGLAPLDPVHGFPQYYQDSTGLALQPCLDLVCDPALPVPDPTLPVSFPNNFPDEFFYSRVINTMTVGTMKVLYVAALEGSFANGAVVAGDQVVFARLRFRILGATPNAMYTFTHPYGVDVVQADGVGFVNSTTDVGIVPIGLLPTAFQLAIGGRVGPFMTALAPHRRRAWSPIRQWTRPSPEARAIRTSSASRGLGSLWVGSRTTCSAHSPGGVPDRSPQRAADPAGERRILPEG